MEDADEGTMGHGSGVVDPQKRDRLEHLEVTP
jgi:hypothetical protein